MVCDSLLSVCPAALQHAGKHMEDSIVASYTALLLGCLCQGSQVRIFRPRLCNIAIWFLDCHTNAPSACR